MAAQLFPAVPRRHRLVDPLHQEMHLIEEAVVVKPRVNIAQIALGAQSGFHDLFPINVPLGLGGLWRRHDSYCTEGTASCTACFPQKYSHALSLHHSGVLS